MSLKLKFIIGSILTTYAIIGIVLGIIVMNTEIWHPIFLFFGLADWLKILFLILGISLILKTKPDYWRVLFKSKKMKKI